MKRKYTIVKADGSKVIREEDDQAPAMSKSQMAAKGINGDTELAHVNQWEEKLLEKLGGAGTRNPQTGLKQFYNTNTWGDELQRLYDQMKSTGQTSAQWGGGTLTPETGGLLYQSAGGGMPVSLSSTSPLASVQRVANEGQAIGNLGYQVSPLTTAGEALYRSQNPGTAVTSKSAGVVPDIGLPPTINWNQNPTIGNPPEYPYPTIGTPPTLPTNKGTTGTALPYQQQAALNTDQAGTATTATGTMAGIPSTSLAKLQSDFKSYFANAAPGSVTQMYGGTITMGQNGTATYTGPSGTFQINANTDPATLYNSIPEIKSAWDAAYGTTGNAANTATGNGMNFPLNIAPTSTSSSNTGSQSYSGLPSSYANQLLASIMPQLQNSAGNLYGNIDNYYNNALGQYNQQMQNAINNNLSPAIAQLAQRGILNSTEGQKVIANVLSSAQEEASTKGYEAAMQAALQKINVPTTLANIAELGKGTASTSTGTQYSYQTDPTQMYQILASLLQAQM